MSRRRNHYSDETAQIQKSITKVSNLVPNTVNKYLAFYYIFIKEIGITCPYT